MTLMYRKVHRLLFYFIRCYLRSRVPVHPAALISFTTPINPNSLNLPTIFFSKINLFTLHPDRSFLFLLSLQFFPSIHSSSLSFQKRGGLPWISTSLDTSSCSKRGSSSPIEARRGSQNGKKAGNSVRDNPAPPIKNPIRRLSYTTVTYVQRA